MLASTSCASRESAVRSFEKRTPWDHTSDEAVRQTKIDTVIPLFMVTFPRHVVTSSDFAEVSLACGAGAKLKAWGVIPRCLQSREAARDNGRQISTPFSFRPHSRALN